MSFPADPIAAVTHPDPYPYYADLVARRPLYRDDALGLWVAAGAEAVTAVLHHEHCRVRPPAEPVPRALVGSPAGEIFRHLVRMNDGPGHCPFKQAVAATLGALEGARTVEESRTWADRLPDETDRPARLADFAFRLPVYVVASLLGLSRDALDQTFLWISDFVPSLAPGCDPERVERGKVAAGHLLELFQAQLQSQLQNRAEDGLLATLARQAERVGRGDPAVIAANGIGFLFQAHDATAGLIGNSLVALAAHPKARKQVTADPGLLRQVVLEVLRYDPPVQNTRRFLARDATVAGQAMREGDTILVVLAAANRDPAVNPHPERFELFRGDRMTFTFGAGVHACPGEALATTIAQAGLERLLGVGLGIDLERFSATYRPSANVRIPLGSVR